MEKDFLPTYEHTMAEKVCMAASNFMSFMLSQFSNKRNPQKVDGAEPPPMAIPVDNEIAVYALEINDQAATYTEKHTEAAKQICKL